jgi:phage regulator Rha-like protein
LDFPSLTYVEYKGNTLGRKAKKEFVDKFNEMAKKVVLFEEEEDDEDEEEEEEEDEDHGFEEEDIIKRLENLKL